MNPEIPHYVTNLLCSLKPELNVFEITEKLPVQQTQPVSFCNFPQAGCLSAHHFHWHKKTIIGELKIRTEASKPIWLENISLTPKSFRYTNP